MLPPALADLPLPVDAVEYAAFQPDGEGTRGTAFVRLSGGGETGTGEDVSPYGDIFGQSFPFSPPPALPLTGSWTLGSFCAALESHALWEIELSWEAMANYRAWAFESAALDLALRLAGRSLPEALGREASPLTFVNSLGLGETPDFDATVGARLERYPSLRFKIDADGAWPRALAERVAATGAVDVVDFKGYYGREIADEAALERVYADVLDLFPDAIIEDPHDAPAVDALLADIRATRVSYDAPIHGPDDVARLGVAVVNVKPSRIGTLERLFGVYAYCEEHAIRMYSGGMGELAIGRLQTQLLSAIFHPDEPNDIAPTPYNEPSLRAGLPESPLTPPVAPGFAS